MADWLEEAHGRIDFDYDAVQDTKRRRSPTRVVSSEDHQLKPRERKTMVSTSRDIYRNFSLARFIVQKHIDFVVEHNFLPRSGDVGLDKELLDFYRHVTKPENFDALERYSLPKYMRLMEAANIVTGDLYSVKYTSGHMQAIEADRIFDPGSRPTNETWVHGVQLDSLGRPRAYAVHRRNRTGFDLERIVPARNMFAYGNYDRFDQVRGVARLAPAINLLKDLHESYDYTLARTKLEQILALKITRSSEFGIWTDDGDDESPDRELDLTNGGLQLLDMDTDENAEFMEAGSPKHDSQQFWRQMTMLTMKCLNIPYFFYDESNTNFFGARTSLLLYLRSVRSDRENVQNFLNNWFCWRLKLGSARNEILLPSGFDCENMRNWSFAPLGIEYWNPVDEISADQMAVDMDLRTMEEIRRERFGDSWEHDVFPIRQREIEMKNQLNQLKVDYEQDNQQTGE